MTIEQVCKRTLHTLTFLACSAGSLGSAAHEGLPNDRNEHTGQAQEAIAVTDFTYVGHVDQVVAGQSFRTVGRLLTTNNELQLSELRSDGRLLSLQVANGSLSAPEFPPFETQRPSAIAPWQSFASSLQAERLPRILVAAQGDHGELKLFDRTRKGTADHPYASFVKRFDERMTAGEVRAAEPGAYVQVMPYAGEGPPDFRLETLSEEIRHLISEPFKLHRFGNARHVVIDDAFVVLPKQPVLVDINGKRFVFHAYTLDATRE